MMDNWTEEGYCRSREGAWIEIYILINNANYNLSRSREGAWIEIVAPSVSDSVPFVAPARERGLK